MSRPRIAAEGLAQGDRVSSVGRIPFSGGEHRCYRMAWTSRLGEGKNHYVAGNPPFSLAAYRGWLEKLGIYPVPRF